MTTDISTARDRRRAWGATADERSSVLPGDDLSPSAKVVTTRAITIAAARADVWPWLNQIGQDRSGFYSYTWMENLVGCRMPRIHELRQEWPPRCPGDKVWMATPERFRSQAYNLVVRTEPEQAIVLVGPADDIAIAEGREATWVWQLVLRATTEHSTRLLVRSRLLRPMYWLEPIHFVMERRMMLTIRSLAEQAAVRTKGPKALLEQRPHGAL